MTPRLGASRDLDKVVRRCRADVLLVADGAFLERELLDMVRMPACLPCDLLVVPRLPEFHTQTGLSDHIGSIPVMRIRTPNLQGPAWAVKRGFDVVVGAVLLAALAPVIAACALATRLEGGPGVIFSQPRVGRNGQVFNCLKFRTMKPADTSEAATRWTISSDQRVGRVGRFLRRSSLDELPQLWNVLRGDMSLVGPRPIRPTFFEELIQEIPAYWQRLVVRPGLTGFAQLRLTREMTWAEKLAHDFEYIADRSVRLYLSIVIHTAGLVLSRPLAAIAGRPRTWA